jgi:hypothetical protein
MAKLKPCCKKELKKVREAIKRGNMLTGLVAASPFAAMFGDGTVDHAQALMTNRHYTQNDWNLFKAAVRGAGQVAREGVQRVTGRHWLHHASVDIEHDLELFWKKLNNTFDP